MRTRQLLPMVLSLVSLPAFSGAPFQVSVVSYPARLPQAAPVVVVGEVTNQSGTPLKVVRGYKGFDISFTIEDEQGRRVEPDRGFIPAIKPSSHYQTMQLQPSWREQRSDTLCCMSNPGVYVVRCVVSSADPYAIFGKEDTKGAWHGSIQSAPVKITITSPQGVDEEAFSHFNGNPMRETCELLARFPTSTYAAYLIVGQIPDYSNNLFKPVPPAQQVRQSREEGKTVRAFPQKKFEDFFQNLEAVARGGRVPDDLKAVVYGFYGDLLVQRGRFDEAESAFTLATSGTASDDKSKVYADRAKAFLEALKSK